MVNDDRLKQKIQYSKDSNRRRIVRRNLGETIKLGLKLKDKEDIAYRQQLSTGV